MTIQQQFCLIERFLHTTTEPFDDWDWDGSELVIFMEKQPIERYFYNDLKEILNGLEINNRF